MAIGKCQQPITLLYGSAFRRWRDWATYVYVICVLEKDWLSWDHLWMHSQIYSTLLTQRCLVKRARVAVMRLFVDCCFLNYAAIGWCATSKWLFTLIGFMCVCFKSFYESCDTRWTFGFGIEWLIRWSIKTIMFSLESLTCFLAPWASWRHFHKHTSHH